MRTPVHHLLVVAVGCTSHGAPAPDASSEPSDPAVCNDHPVSGVNDLSAVRGGLIAFGCREPDGDLQICVARPDGSERTQLTFDGQNGLADWSPDGTRLAFMAIRGDDHFIGVMNADGSDVRLIAEGGVAPDWAPDGTTLAFAANGQIFTVAADGTGQKAITSSSTFKVRPSWSPDGKQIAFMQLLNPTDPNDPKPQVGIMNADGSDEHILTAADRTNTCVELDGSTRVLETAHDANAPSWSPVDDRIVFWSGIETRYGQVWTIRADGSASTQLTHETHHSNNDDPSWAPDGSKILFSTGRDGSNELWVMDPDGANEMRLWAIDAGPFPGRGAWQPLSAGP
jgi:Tol biopolymer transport system component